MKKSIIKISGLILTAALFTCSVPTYSVDAAEVNSNSARIEEADVPDIIGQDTAVVKPTGDAADAVCNTDFYRRKYEDLDRAYGKDSKKLFKHYLDWGIGEGRDASEAFDVKYYLDSNPDLQKAFGKKNYKAAFNHFIKYGYAENRDLSPVFNMAYYIDHNPDVKQAYGDNYYGIIKHFLNCGMSEGRASSPNFDLETYKASDEELRILYTKYNSLYYDDYLISGRDEGRKAV